MAMVPQVSLATLNEWLQEARAAYHRLMLGDSVVEIMVDGYQTKYGRADAAKLQAYIARLEAQIAGRGSRGAIGISF